ncbi:hypothetical protein [Kordia sp.]|uniref:hypothetical protein n=1 Tax=Kordia sp. TaxID=1965332 RepID=UPI0025B8CF8F|nr:hypothetical protein [Kordia sp.]MCH2195001.1 hypothetical protein [Kordia sp.]
MYIEHIWVELLEYENHSITKICKALHAIGHKYQMILVDWYLKLKVDLTNHQEITKYLTTLEEEYKDV